MARLDVRVFGLTLGCIWSFVVLALGIASMLLDRGSRIVKLFSTVYMGYRSTVQGVLIGAAWGFMDGAVSGVMIAWLYNRILF
ncbi:MAG: bacteriophage holin [Candidatus Omnitrophica bacterium]|nr:bacteriophage holin [Candidatus Omnitrophota bacterium]